MALDVETNNVMPKWYQKNEWVDSFQMETLYSIDTVKVVAMEADLQATT